MKLPKRVRILDRTFNVIRGNKYLGYFQFIDKDNGNKPTIYITDRKDDDVVLEAFMHETMEIALELTRVRYERPDEDGSFIFFYSHKDHDIVSKIMSGVVNQLLKVNGRIKTNKKG